MKSRSRIRVYVASIVAVGLCIVSIAIIAFCMRYTHEMGAQENTSSFVPNFVLVDSTTETKKDNSHEIAEFQSRLDFYYDDMEETTWIYAKGQEKGISDFSCYAYIGQKANRSWLRFKLGFHQDSWIFMDAIKLKSESGSFDYILEFGDRKSEISNGIYEWIDIPLSEVQTAELRQVCDGAETKVRCKGEQYYVDFVLTVTQKENLLTIFDYYDLIKE